MVCVRIAGISNVIVFAKGIGIFEARIITGIGRRQLIATSSQRQQPNDGHENIQSVSDHAFNYTLKYTFLPLQFRGPTQRF